jgi:hypothetical protein
MQCLELTISTGWWDERNTGEVAMRAWFGSVVVLVVLSSGIVAAAEPVREYVDPETGALVFDATDGTTEFPAPTTPREFRDVPEYLAWVLERFHARPVLGEKGDLIDVQGGWVLLGRPTYSFEGKTHVVRQPILQVISGPFGFVVIGGEKYEMPLDEEPPPFEEIEPVLYSLINYRRSCSGAPLGGVDYCVQASAFKHIYLFYQSIGGTLDIAGKAIVAPTTKLSLTLSFRNASNRVIRISTPMTVDGVALLTRRGISGLGIAEWGVFGNPFVDPTEILFVLGTASGPKSNGGTGSAEASWFQPF